MSTLHNSHHHATGRKAARAVAEGRVQGVGFRYWTVLTAKKCGITGWVRNCPDYSVEIFAEGDGAALHEFFTAVREGHLLAHVSNFTISAAPYEGLSSFEVRY